MACVSGFFFGFECLRSFLLSHKNDNAMHPVNEDQSYGLVYIEFVCVESHCGQADVVLFRRIGKSYKVAQVFSLWEI